MKRHALIIVLALALIAVSVVAFKFYRKTEQSKQVSDRVKERVNTEAEIIARKVDQQGLEHATIEAAGNVIPYSQVKEPAVSPALMDTVAMAIGILKKQIQDLTIINTRVTAENLRANKKIDELGRSYYNYSSKYLNLNYRPGNPADTSDSGSFDYSYDNDLTVTQYWKRNKVIGLPIGGKHSYIDIYSSDPKATIKGVKKLTVKQEQPLLGLRIQAASAYNFKTGMMTAGPGLQFDFKRLSIQGSYQYSWQDEDWRPAIQTRYDLIRF